MKLNIDKEVVEWYKKELHLKDGQSIKLYGKVYGPMNGFSMAIEITEPTRPFFTQELDGVTFFVEKNDAWFFEDKEINATMDSTYKEPRYDFEVQK